MRPAVCKTNLRVHIPMDTEDCDYWLVFVEDINSIEKPDRNHGYLDSNGVFYVWNGTFEPVSGILWGNIHGNLANQTDLAGELAKAITSVSVNGTNLTKSNQKVNVTIPITSISKNGTPLTITNRNVNISLSEYALLADLPTKLSDLENDEGFDVAPTKLSELINDMGFGPAPTKVSELQNDAGYITQAAITQSMSTKVDKVAGKGLSTNDFTNDLLAKVNLIDDMQDEIASLKSQLADALSTK